MSNNEQTSGTKNVFSVCQDSINKIFTDIRQSIPQYHQSFTNVQQEYLQAYETVVDSTITLQKEYAEKFGVATNISQATLKVMNDTTKEFVKAASIHNQMTLTTIDVAQQNIKTFNDNAKSFADLNRNIIQSYVSSFATKN